MQGLPVRGAVVRMTGGEEPKLGCLGVAPGYRRRRAVIWLGVSRDEEGGRLGGAVGATHGGSGDEVAAAPTKKSLIRERVTWHQDGCWRLGGVEAVGQDLAPCLRRNTHPSKWRTSGLPHTLQTATARSRSILDVRWTSRVMRSSSWRWEKSETNDASCMRYLWARRARWM